MSILDGGIYNSFIESHSALGCGASIDLTSLGAYYKFNLDATDSSVNGLHGTEVSSPTYSAGKFGDAISLNGTSQYVTVPDNGFLEGLNGIITVLGWIKITDFASEGLQYLASKRGGGGSSGWSIGVSSTDLYLSLALTNLTIPITITNGAWTHIGFTYENANANAKVYKDGIQILDMYALGTNPLVNTSNMFIGRKNDAVEGYVKGSIDELSIWQRILTADEIATLYILTCPLNS